MPTLYPQREPYNHGMLDVGDGNQLYWETCGNPAGVPAVVLHGGPGSGCTPGWRQFFNPDLYRIVLFDQRGCGRSTPHASDVTVSLECNTTHHLIADIEELRRHLGIQRWLVFGGSWGSTLGLAYAETHPERVAAMVLFSIVTTTQREVQWVTRSMRRYFPAQWEKFRVGSGEHDLDSFVDAYARLLQHPEPAVREKAAKDWCAWEDSHVNVLGRQPDRRYEDPAFRMCSARLVTHYWRHAAWLDEGQLLREARKLAGIPGILVHGRLDLSAPPDIAWDLAQAWPGAELILIDDAGHGAQEQEMREALVAAIDRHTITGEVQE